MNRILRVVIREGEQEEPKVEVSLPLKLAKWALRLLPVVKTKLETISNQGQNGNWFGKGQFSFRVLIK